MNLATLRTAACNQQESRFQERRTECRCLHWLVSGLDGCEAERLVCQWGRRLVPTGAGRVDTKKTDGRVLWSIVLLLTCYIDLTEKSTREVYPTSEVTYGVTGGREERER